ncbi:MAG: polyphosphate kinase 1 [Phycisphaerales bacterium]
MNRGYEHDPAHVVPAGGTTRADHEPDAESPEPRFLNRELTWLEFNKRVLHEAQDERTPLLERVRFLSIFTSNLDEFFMKRVGGLKRQVAVGVATRTLDGMTPSEQLAAIREAALPLLAAQASCFTDDIRPALAEEDIHLLGWDEITDAEREWATVYFRERVYPVLTPLAVDPGHPFPFISNLSLSLGVLLRHPERDEKLFARVKVPEVLARWIRLPSDGGHRFLRLVELIRHNLSDLFTNMEVLEVMQFRLTRNADMKRDEEDADDLLSLIEEEVRQRRFERVVRLEHGPDPDPWMLKFLMNELNLEPSDVYELPVEVDYSGLKPIADLNLPELSYRPWNPIMPPAFADEETDVFSVIRNGDVLVHHPYENFSASVERFMRAAASDPNVLAIKMTMYRTGDDSPFIHTLIRAAEAGKQVVCVVELKARFDEERNIYVAQALEEAGVHVVYGLVGLKTHAKTVLVVRKEADGVRCYAHIGTGNYHVQTAKLYTDLGLFTARREMTNEIVELFNHLTGRSLMNDSEFLLVAPLNMKRRFLAMIEREVEHHHAGRPARITAKMNSLEDREICEALYAASQAGLPIDLIVRGFCALRPGVPGLSETIRVTSIIGRFLEHSRIYHFQNGAGDPLDGEFFFGSADWMYRNLHNRVEVVAPIIDRSLRVRVWEALQIGLDDRRQTWVMQPDGSYVQCDPGSDDEAIGVHERLMRLAERRIAEAVEGQIKPSHPGR